MQIDGTFGTRLISEKKILSQPVNFSDSDRLL